jgi:signal transduction histidine kinase
MKRFRSIISRLIALHIMAIGVTSLLMPVALYWLLDTAANDLHRDALRAHAITIAGFLRPQPDGGLTMEIPSEVRSLYSGGYGLYAYAVLDSAGHVLFSSRSDKAPLFDADEKTAQDWFVRQRRGGSVMFGVSVARPIGDRVYWIQVGQDLAHRDVIIDDVVSSFFPRVAWITFPILLLLLAIDIAIFRRALDPVREASNTASSIGPTRTDVRLPEQSMPTEIVPLVHAVNQALDRLEAGFSAQRNFTADMAHELRTPLAIVRARVDSLEPGAVRDALRSDLVNMTRTVNQVLDIAELENFVVAGEARADIQAVCVDAVAFMAPLAVEMSKTIALTGAVGPVWVHGNAEALFRAVRNLVENAIRHTPPGVSIEVELGGDGVVRVLDDGPGVPEADREAIFRRFWRRDRESTEGRGLGLAIVSRVAQAHDGSITIEERPGGGAIFTLRLKPASDPPP